MALQLGCRYHNFVPINSSMSNSFAVEVDRARDVVKEAAVALVPLPTK